MYMHMYNGHLRTWFYGPYICTGLCTYCCKPNITAKGLSKRRGNHCMHVCVKAKVLNGVVTLSTCVCVCTHPKVSD